jgi:hypothetical protein
LISSPDQAQSKCDSETEHLCPAIVFPFHTGSFNHRGFDSSRLHTRISRTSTVRHSRMLLSAVRLGSRQARPELDPRLRHSGVKFLAVTSHRYVRDPTACGSRNHAFLNSSGMIGKRRMRLPVAAKIALATAGASGGTPGSPTPPAGALLERMCTSTTGISFILSIG